MTFVAACAVHAAYAWQSIRGRSAGWKWHGLQYGSCGLFVLAGLMAGWQRPGWHDFGTMAAAAALGIPVYVVLLHFLLRRF